MGKSIRQLRIRSRFEQWTCIVSKKCLAYPFLNARTASPALAAQNCGAHRNPRGNIPLRFRSIGEQLTMIKYSNANVKIGIGLFNLLPFLPLDGGLILLACFELALRTRAPILVRLGFSLFGLGCLGALFLYVSFWDIKGLLGILSSPVFLSQSIGPTSAHIIL
jgi:hypothetical protein